jgi:FeS assembly protein SufD
LPLESSPLYAKYYDLDESIFDGIEVLEGKMGQVSKGLDFIKTENAHLISKDSVPIKLTHIADGVIFTDIHNAISNHSHLLLPFFELNGSKNEDTKLAFLNNALYSAGFFLYIPKNTKLSMPIRAINLFTKENSLLGVKNIVFLDEGAQATILEENYSQIETGGNSIFSSNTSFQLKKNSSLNYGSINGLDENTVVFLNKNAQIENDAKANFSGGFIGGKRCISNLDSCLVGNNSNVEDFEVIFGSKQQQFNVSSNLFHIGENSNGKVAAKGIFNDASRGLFKGMVNIGKLAKGTKSYLSSHSILLSKDASSDAIPGLQINNNDVKATHSASVSQIDESQLFYLMSRGFSKEDAKKTIVNGFVEPIIRQMNLPEVQLRIRALFELKWDGLGLEHLPDKIKLLSEQYIPEMGGQGELFEHHYKYR